MGSEETHGTVDNVNAALIDKKGTSFGSAHLQRSTVFGDTKEANSMLSYIRNLVLVVVLLMHYAHGARFCCPRVKYANDMFLKYI